MDSGWPDENHGSGEAQIPQDPGERNNLEVAPPLQCGLSSKVVDHSLGLGLVLGIKVGLLRTELVLGLVFGVRLRLGSGKGVTCPQ